MLNGWKVIAAHLKRDERTAMRWAAQRSMPVHRMPGRGRGSVYAVAEELDAWLAVDRLRVARASHAALPVTDPVPAPSTNPPPASSRGRHWIYGALVVCGVLFLVVITLVLYRSHSDTPDAKVDFSDPAAKAMFLQADYDWNLRTAVSLARAVREYSDTIGHDPRMPIAYVGLANSYLLLREYGSVPDGDAYTRAEAAAQAALALSPNCAGAHRALAFIDFWWRRDRTAARREFERALALEPDDPLTHHWLANALLANGQAKEALREIDRARDLDPVATSIVADRAAILYFAGYRAEGLAALRALANEQTEDVSPHRMLAAIALAENRPEEFLREFTMAARLRSDAVGMAEARRLGLAGPNATAIETMMLSDARKSGTGWFQIAKLASLAGRREEAKDALARACDAREPATISAPSDMWLSRALSPGDIAERCGSVIPLV